MTTTSQREEKNSRRLDSIIVAIVIFTIILLFSVFLISTIVQLINHRDAIGIALSAPVDHAANIAYLKSINIGIIKISALIVSFLVIFVGSLYVLRVEETRFYTSAEAQGSVKIVLSTTSPGLVLVFLGALLVVFSIYKEATIEYHAPDLELGEQVTAETFEDALELGAFRRSKEETGG